MGTSIAQPQPQLPQPELQGHTHTLGSFAHTGHSAAANLALQYAKKSGIGKDVDLKSIFGQKSEQPALAAKEVLNTGATDPSAHSKATSDVIQVNLGEPKTSGLTLKERKANNTGSSQASRNVITLGSPGP
jgi:hypothetical protein